MNSLLAYILLGVSLAAPVGPVNSAQLDTGIKNGFSNAWIFGFGAILADVLYMILVYFGVGQIVDSLFIKTILWSFGCFVLTYTGVENLLALHKIEIDFKSGKRIRLRQSLFAGFFIALLNPLNILFWLGIYGSVLAETSEKLSENQLMIYSLAIIFGILLWDTLISFLSSGARRFLSTRLLKIISLLSSLSMLVFGIYFGIQAYHALFH